MVLVTLAAADPARGAEVSNEGGETVAGWVKSPANPIFRPDPKALWERERVTACQVVRQGDWHVMFYIGFRDVDHAQIGLALHEGEDLGF